MYNKILEETGKQFFKRFLQGAAFEISANLIVKGIETAFDLYKQRRFMEMNVEYGELVQQQAASQQQGDAFDEDEEEEEQHEPAPKPKPTPKPRKSKKT
jgi:hypothetical protein